MIEPWVCIDCGARQGERGACRACGGGDTLDARDERTRELMYDVDLRLTQKAETRARMIAVVVAIGTIVALWFVPAYRSLRGNLYPGLPFFFDQWLFTALIGVGVSKLLERRLVRKRFPYLNESQQIV